MKPKHPIYVISKGRWESGLTAKILEAASIPYHVVVEPQEFDNYAATIDPKNIYTLPFSNLGKGSIPARNWVWEHAIEMGATRHWILDDNIREFSQLNRHKFYRITSGTIFKIAEDFIARYRNVALAGFHDYAFSQKNQKMRPFIINTRIYSCILIKTDLPFRWRGRYNEDTDLSLQVLKAGWCTVLFRAFLMDKSTTMTMKGGNTDELYQNNGRLKMAQSLKAQHPDVTEFVWRWGRWQHKVDYSKFKRNKLIKRDDIEIAPGIDNYGMKLVSPGEKATLT